ncbi:hypothetical protein, partial [Vibrio crassostreae]|uniref:hypothetical protein n=1 Tax=Vibrio crassostreae TaxID=246167 RepID=UPI00352D44D9
NNHPYWPFLSEIQLGNKAPLNSRTLHNNSLATKFIRYTLHTKNLINILIFQSLTEPTMRDFVA